MLVIPLLADDHSNAALGSSQTDRFKVAQAGAIRLENSFGEVDIDGWDRPEVEVIVVRSTERLYDAKTRTEGQRRLDSVQITSRQDGNDVVISTAYPVRSGFTHPLSRRSDVEIRYRIKAPRDSKLIIDHHNGGVNVFDISGDIRATVINGQITLTLASGGHYAIDAQCKIGAIYSDFEGRDQPRRFLGEGFDRTGTAPATNLYLRVRLGDIILQKLHGPSAD